MPYAVMVDDNFHYMDAGARCASGVFDDAEDALRYCREVVDEYLMSALEPGMAAEDLWSSYTSFGDDPFIRSINAPPVRFSAWDYARERCEVLCLDNPARPARGETDEDFDPLA